MTLTKVLPVVPGGVGASVAVQDLVAQKVIVVDAVTGSITIEASADNAVFCPIATFTPVDSDKTVIAPAGWLRVRATAGGAAGVQVMAEGGLVRTGTIPAPPANGPGAALDVSTFGPLSTVFVGPLNGSGSINIEISPDGVDWTPDFKTFTTAGCDTKSIPARFIRAVGANATATISIASEEPATNALTSPASAFVFRPGGVQGGSVYTIWADLVAAMNAVAGLKLLEFDNSIAPCTVPAGTWNMSDVAWTAFVPRNGVTQVEVFVVEGAILEKLRFLAGGMFITCQATLTPPVSDFGPGGGGTIVQMGMRMDDSFAGVRCTGGAPFFDFGANSVQVRLVKGDWNSALIGTNPPARLAVGGTCNFHLYAGTIGPDSVDAPVGSTVNFNLYTGTSWAVDQSTILGTFSKLTPQSRSRFRALPQSVGGAAPVPSIAPIAGVQTGDCLQFNTTAGDIAQSLPNIVTSWVTAVGAADTVGHLIMVKNSVGANDVNVSPAGGQTIDGGAGPVAIGPNQSKIFWSDGVSNWRTVAEFMNFTLDAMGGGAAATLGTIGGTGPTVAGQNTWVQLNIGGVDYWLPAWI